MAPMRATASSDESASVDTAMVMNTCESTIGSPRRSMNEATAVENTLNGVPMLE